MTLDADLVRRRSAELGLSQRALAAAMSVTAPVLRSLDAGTNHEAFTVAQLQGLARALGVSVPDLFISDSPAPDAEIAAADPDVAEDARTVGAALDAAEVLTPTTALAEALGWPLARVEAALEVLDAALHAAGFRLHRLYNRVSIVRAVDAADREQIRQVTRSHLARESLNLTEARLLRKVVTGGGAPKELSNAETVALGVLVNAGLVVLGKPVGASASRPWVASPDVMTSLVAVGKVQASASA